MPKTILVCFFVAMSEFFKNEGYNEFCKEYWVTAIYCATVIQSKVWNTKNYYNLICCSNCGGLQE